MATELAAAYLTLIPTLKGAQKRIEAQLSGVDLAPVGKSMGASLLSGLSGTDVVGAVSKVGGFLSSTFTRSSKIAGTAIAGIGAALGGLAVSGGLTRALNIEKAQTMFKGLKLQWDDYKETINDAVTGTAFTMDAAALTAASLAASGVSAGEQMERALNGAVGVAATFGSSLEDIGGIYSKVSAQGKLSGETIQQFADRGINVTSVLTAALGKSSDEVKDMVKDGKVDFKTFSDAMYEAFGDSAQAANATFTGAMANMRSAVSRFGEKFMTPFKDSAIPVFNASREAINAVSVRLDPLVAKFAELAGTVSGKLAEGMGAFKSSVEAGAGPAQALASAIDAIAGSGAATRIQTLVTGFLAMSAVGPMLTSAASGAGAATAAFDRVMGVISPIGPALKGAAEGAASFAKRLGAAGLAAGKAFGDTMYKSLASVDFTRAVDGIALKIGVPLARAKGTVRERVTEIADTIASRAPAVVVALGRSASEAVRAFKDKFSLGKAAEGEASLFSRAMDKVKRAASGAASGAAGFFGAVARGAVATAGALAPMAGGLLAAGASAVAMGIDVQGAMDGVLAQVQAFADNLPTITNDLVSLLPGFIEQAVALIPAIVTALTTAMSAIADALPAILPMLADGLTQAITQLAPLVVTFAPLLLSAGLQLFTALVNSLSEVVPVVVALLPGMVNQVCGVLVSNMPLLLSAGLELFMALVTAFLDMLPDLIQNLPELISQVVGSIEGFMPRLLSAGKQLFMKLAESVPLILGSLLSALGNVLSKLPGKVKEWVPKMLSAGKDLIRGMVNGISDMGGWVVDKIKSVCSDALGAVKSFFGIASPSKVMRKMFGYVGDGMVLGLADKSSEIRRTMEGIASGVVSAASVRPTLGLRYQEAAAGPCQGGAFDRRPTASYTTIYNVDGVTYDDGSNVADTVDRLFRQTRLIRRS